MGFRNCLRLGTTLLVLAGVLQVTSTSALADCAILRPPDTIDYFEITPTYQLADTGTVATISVRGFDCLEDEVIGAEVLVRVTGANPSVAYHVTPFVLSHSGMIPGEDLVSFYAMEKGPSAHAKIQWLPTSASIQAGGAVLKVARNSGSPQAGAAIFECDVQAAYATEVAIENCTLLGPGGAVLAAASGPIVPGPTAAISGVIPTIDSSSFDVCWSVRATFETGVVRDEDCTPVLVNETL